MYPELEKMASAKQASHIIGEFMEWLHGQGILLAKYGPDTVSDPRLWPYYKSINDLLAQYFDIDLNKVQQEKRQILVDLRNERIENTFVRHQMLKEAIASVSMDREGDGQTIALGPVKEGEKNDL